MAIKVETEINNRKRISCLRISKDEISDYLGKGDNIITSQIVEETINGKKVVDKTYLVLQKTDVKNNVIIPWELLEFID